MTKKCVEMSDLTGNRRSVVRNKWCAATRSWVTQYNVPQEITTKCCVMNNICLWMTANISHLCAYRSRLTGFSAILYLTDVRGWGRHYHRWRVAYIMLLLWTERGVVSDWFRVTWTVRRHIWEVNTCLPDMSADEKRCASCASVCTCNTATHSLFIHYTRDQAPVYFKKVTDRFRFW